MAQVAGTAAAARARHAHGPGAVDSEVANYTAQKYLAGTYGWNPDF